MKGRTFDINVGPKQIIDHLDTSGLPAWMSYVEARRGSLSLFNDIVYVKLKGSADFARVVSRGPVSATFGADIKVDFEQAVVELGGAWEVAKWWSGGQSGSGSPAALDLLAGARYWRQDGAVSADLTTTLAVGGAPGISISGSRAIARSGTVEWVDPFIGARLRQQLAPGQEVIVRGDIGGFGAGSQFSWQMLGTLNSLLTITHDVTVESYVGYRALSVDYSQGSGATRYEYNAIQQGPVMGLTMRF